MVTTHSPANRKRRHAYQPDQHRDGNNQLRKREKNYASNITGRNLTLSINSVSYADQASTVTLERENNQQVLEVLSGRAYKTVDKTATLNVELYLDDTSSAGIISALWDAASSAPDTSLPFSFDVNGDTFTGNVFPVFPTVGGAATDVLTTSLSFVVEDGTVARA
jgi:hypothetical protein